MWWSLPGLMLPPHTIEKRVTSACIYPLNQMVECRPEYQRVAILYADAIVGRERSPHEAGFALGPVTHIEVRRLHLPASLEGGIHDRGDGAGGEQGPLRGIELPALHDGLLQIGR